MTGCGQETSPQPSWERRQAVLVRLNSVKLVMEMQIGAARYDSELPKVPKVVMLRINVLVTRV